MDGVRPPNREGEITPAGTPLVNIFQTIPKKLSGNFLLSPLPMSVSHFPPGARRFPPPLSASPLHRKALSGLTDWPTAPATLSGSFLCKSTQTERAGQVSRAEASPRRLRRATPKLRHLLKHWIITSPPTATAPPPPYEICLQMSARRGSDLEMQMARIQFSRISAALSECGTCKRLLYGLLRMIGPNSFVPTRFGFACAVAPGC